MADYLHVVTLFSSLKAPTTTKLICELLSLMHDSIFLKNCSKVQNTCTYVRTYTAEYVTEHKKTGLMYTKYISLYYGTYFLYCLRY